MLYDREITSLPDRFLTEVCRTTIGFISQQLSRVMGVTSGEIHH